MLRDCATAISLDLHCAKAYYRSAQALLALERLEEALDACGRCLSFDPDNDGVKMLRDRMLKAKTVKEEKERTRAQRMKREARERERLKRAFRVK